MTLRHLHLHIKTQGRLAPRNPGGRLRTSLFAHTTSMSNNVQSVTAVVRDVQTGVVKTRVIDLGRGLPAMVGVRVVDARLG